MEARRVKDWATFERLSQELKTTHGLDAETERAAAVGEIRAVENQEGASIRARNEAFLAEQNRQTAERREREMCTEPLGIRVLVLGMEQGGKSSMMAHLAADGTNIKELEPSVGWMVEEIEHSTKYHVPQGLSLLSWGGENRYFQRTMRQYLRYIYGGIGGLPPVQGIIWMLDAQMLDENNLNSESWMGKELLEEHKDLFWWYLGDSALSQVPLVVLANKQDHANALPPEEVAHRMGLIESHHDTALASDVIRVASELAAEADEGELMGIIVTSDTMSTYLTVHEKQPAMATICEAMQMPARDCNVEIFLGSVAITEGSFAENGIVDGASLHANCREHALCTGLTKHGAEWAVFGTSLKGVFVGSSCKGVDAAMTWLSARLPPPSQ